MIIHISSDGPPIYQQIADQIRYRIVSGRLDCGDELPAIRTLAERIKVNPNTVARAYRELEQEGLVEKRRTRGTYVCERPERLNKSQRRKQITPEVDRLLIQAYQLGLSKEDIVELIARRDQQIRQSN